jgi:DNA-binding NtrC family response regulator
LPGNLGASFDALMKIDWSPCLTENMKEAEEIVRRGQVSVGLIIFDYKIEECQLEPLSELLALKGINWIAMVSDDCMENGYVLKLITECFFDYHRLPIDRRRLFTIMGHAHGMSMLEQNVQDQQKPVVCNDTIIGTCHEMQKIKNKVARIACVDAPVLIIGESGTGKELVANAVHKQSSRGSGPYEAVNCAALPATLIQSELFGHEKGAFTGASSRKIGRFEAANGGTIFLDEIGDLSLELQTNLLRILEQKVVRRVGGTCDVPIDVRVVAATHVNLEAAVREGSFREDLYYRLNVLRLEIPPLREREEDIELLARHFLKKFSKEMRSGVRGFTAQSLKAMRSYSWPGNVRELINCIQQAVALCDQTLISPRDLGRVERRSTSRTPLTLEAARSMSEKQTIISALRKYEKNISSAAKALDVSRATVYRLIEKYMIEV